MRIVTERIEIRHRFSPLVERMDREGDNLAIQRLNFTPITFAAPDTHCAEALMLLDGTGTTRQNLITNAGVGDNSNATETIDYYLGRFCYGRLLKWDITLDGESIVRISSQDRQFGPNETETPPAKFRIPPLCLVAARWRGHDPRVSGIARPDDSLQPRHSPAW